MSEQTVIDSIKAGYERMSPQMQQASRYLIDNPRDVAFYSMREIARRAGVMPSTMTRLAKRLGFSGYDEMRAKYLAGLERDTTWLGSQAEGMLTRRAEVGEPGLVEDFSATLSGYLGALSEPGSRATLEAAADSLMKAERILCVGARSSHPVAYMFCYLMSYFMPRVRNLGDPGGASMDALLDAGPGDVLFAVSFEPSARSTVEAIRVAAEAQCGIVSITDHELNDIARASDVAIVAPRHAPTFFDSMTPAFAAAEMLAAMIASRVGPDVTDRVRAREARLAQMGVWTEGDRPGAPSSAADTPRTRSEREE